MNNKEWEITQRMMLGDFSYTTDFNPNHDELGRFATGSGYDSLIPKDSYINTEEYQKAADQFRDAVDRSEELRKEIEVLEEQYNLESHPKPREEWDIDDELDALLGKKPRVTTEVGAAIKEELDAKQKERWNLTKQRDMAGDRLRKIKEAEHYKQMMNYHSTGLRPATKSDYEGFRTDTTGTSFYDDILEGRKPGYRSALVEMSPREYLEKCAYEIFDNATIESTIRGVERKNVAKYTEMMKNGTKFDLPYLNFKNQQQEGRHRALAAYDLGIETIPVLAIF